MGPGLDKVSLELDGQPALTWLTDRISSWGLGVLVSARPGQTLPKGLDKAVVEDAESNAGPLAGLRAGLEVASARRWATLLVLSCDAIAIEPSDVTQLVRASRGRDGAVVADEEGRVQPLVGVYDVGAGRDAFRRLDSARSGAARVFEWLSQLDVATVGARACSSRFVAAPCNTPEQWRVVCAALGIDAPALSGTLGPHE